jgi:hypothetical protein
MESRVRNPRDGRGVKAQTGSREEHAGTNG